MWITQFSGYNTLGIINMKKLRILLTGDDGYNAPGTRVLARVLKDEYDLKIAATKFQQSGVGGILQLIPKSWGEDTVDGVDAVWVDGYPAEVMEFAQTYFKPFDLVISGINWGANISSATISSGTFAAAFRALTVGVAPRALVLSWHLPQWAWYKKHQGNEDIDDYLQYPGRTAVKILELALDNDFWGAKIINVNLPQERSQTVIFTKPLPKITDFYVYPNDIDYEKKIFSYPSIGTKKKPLVDLQYDTGALLTNKISITLCQDNFLDLAADAKIRNREIKL